MIAACRSKWGLVPLNVVPCSTLAWCLWTSTGLIGGPYIVEKHGLTAGDANEAVDDPERIVIEPDYSSTSGRSVRIIGFSQSANDLLTVIVLTDGGVTYGVNAWRSNARDRRIYEEGRLG